MAISSTRTATVACVSRMRMTAASRSWCAACSNAEMFRQYHTLSTSV